MKGPEALTAVSVEVTISQGRLGTVGSAETHSPGYNSSCRIMKNLSMCLQFMALFSLSVALAGFGFNTWLCVDGREGGHTGTPDSLLLDG